MKKELVSILVFIVCAMFAEATAMAQGIIVHKKNGEKIILPYSTLDCIETYTAGIEEIDGHDCVDLGLSVRWATCNVGAYSPEDYGNYFAWGEIETKSTYTINNSVTYKKQMKDFTGNPQYDVVRAKWGSKWRIPTKKEMEELEEDCTWIWTTQNGVKGMKVTGPNGNSIFFPAAGRRTGTLLSNAGELGRYWSSTPYESSTQSAYSLNFGSSDHLVSWSLRDGGFSVRPVTE